MKRLAAIFFLFGLLLLCACQKSKPTVSSSAETTAETTAQTLQDVYASRQEVPLLKRDFQDKLETPAKYNGSAGTFTMTSGAVRFFKEGKSEPTVNLLLKDVRFVVRRESGKEYVPIDFVTTSGKTTVDVPAAFVDDMSKYVFMSKTELTMT